MTSCHDRMLMHTFNVANHIILLCTDNSIRSFTSLATSSMDTRFHFSLNTALTSAQRTSRIAKKEIEPQERSVCSIDK